MSDFFDKINYSSSNEDGMSEIKALKINKNDTILSIS
jgi:hypothetical protein